MLACNLERLRADLDELSGIGRASDHGIHRTAFSAADMQARAWLRERLEAAGLPHAMDGAGNVSGWLGDATATTVMTGSHLDSVPGAGHLDGALGVICGLEALRVLAESDLGLRHRVELVGFSDEEGRFGGLFGSQALCGQLTPEDLAAAEDLDGVKLTEAMAEHGMDAREALAAHRAPGSILAFVELHIEQGPVLDRQQVPLGVVEAITGLFKWNVRYTGAADHAGTTPMDLRRDAFQGMAEFAQQMTRVLEEYGSPRSRATVGRVQLHPGAANVVPGLAEFSLDVRDTNPAVLADLASAFRRTLEAIARRRGLMFEFEVLSEIAPVRCHDSVVSAIEAAAAEREVNAMRLPSGAAHDTQIMASIAPAGMIFVPSRDGRSHSPAEWTSLRDIETGTNVLIGTLLRLAA